MSMMVFDGFVPSGMSSRLAIEPAMTLRTITSRGNIVTRRQSWSRSLSCSMKWVGIPFSIRYLNMIVDIWLLSNPFASIVAFLTLLYAVASSL